MPIRELIQNARDAIAARRLLEGRPADWGQVSVRIRGEGEDHWLDVSDTGVGMSSTVLTRTLLDFGASLWDSEAVADEFPGLLSKGFQHVGRFGIGFFSVFMLGQTVRVTTRRYDEGPLDTRVLEFATGPLGGRSFAPGARMSGCATGAQPSRCC